MGRKSEGDGPSDQSLDARVVALETELAAWKAFVINVANDLRNPLGALLLASEGLEKSLRSEADPLRHVERASAMQRYTRRLVVRTSVLLDAGRAATGTLSLELAEIDLSALLAEHLDALRPELEMVSLEMQADVEPGIVGVWDAQKLEFVVSTFVDLGMRRSMQGPIRVRLFRDEPWVCLEAHFPQGCLDADEVSLLSAPFSQAVIERPGRRSVFELWMARRIAEALGGSLLVRVGEQTSLILRLPLKRR